MTKPSSVRLNLQVDVHVDGSRRWARVVAWGSSAGHYGSLASVKVELPADWDPTDPEQLVSCLLDTAHAVVYAS